MIADATITSSCLSCIQMVECHNLCTLHAWCPCPLSAVVQRPAQDLCHLSSQSRAASWRLMASLSTTLVSTLCGKQTPLAKQMAPAAAAVGLRCRLADWPGLLFSRGLKCLIGFRRTNACNFSLPQSDSCHGFTRPTSHMRTTCVTPTVHSPRAAASTHRVQPF